MSLGVIIIKAFSFLPHFPAVFFFFFFSYITAYHDLFFRKECYKQEASRILQFGQAAGSRKTVLCPQMFASANKLFALDEKWELAKYPEKYKENIQASEYQAPKWTHN